MISPRLFHGWYRIAKTGLTALALSFTAISYTNAQEAPEVVVMNPPTGMELANILVVKTDPNPVGVIVLLNGHNVSPEKLLADPAWQELAKKHRYGLIGCYFKNDMNAKSGFYQFPANGAGKVLTDAVQKIYKKNLPMAIYGFSAGAQFTSRFVALNPRAVKVFAAYAPGSADTVRPTPQLPPGVILCGENDTERFDKVQGFYNEGRANGFRWVWLPVPNNDHKAAPAAVDFVRAYFDGVLSASGTPAGVFMNVADGTLGSSTRKPAFGWLPDAKLATDWKSAAGK